MSAELATDSCAACGVLLASDARFCQSCGQPVPEASGAPPSFAFEGRSSGTCCRGCGAALGPSSQACPGCGRRARRPSEKPAPADAALRETIEELDTLLADSSIHQLSIVERSSTALLDRCLVAVDAAGEPLLEISAHPSRARVAWWAIRELVAAIGALDANAEPSVRAQLEALRAQLDGPPAGAEALAEGLAEALLVALPRGRATVLVDRAHRVCRPSLRVLAELAKLGVARIVLRAPVDVPGLDAVATLRDLGAERPLVDDPAARFSARKRAALRALATLGWRAPVEAVAAVLGRDGHDALERLASEGTLLLDGEHVAFADPDLADDVERLAPPSLRAELHDAALGWYASRGERLELRAEHAAAAPDLPTAVLLLDMWARDCAKRGDTPGALEALTRGLDRIRRAMAEDEDAATSRAGARLARSAAELLLREGDSRTAEGLLREALDRPALEPGERAELTVMVGALAVGRGRHEDARRQLERASEWARQGDRPRVTADAELWLAQVAHSRGDDTDAIVAHVSRAWEALGRDDQLSAKTVALVERVMKILARAGHAPRAVELLDALLSGAVAKTGRHEPRLRALRDGLAA